VISGSARAPEAAQGCGGADDDDLGADPGDCSTIGYAEIRIEQPAADDFTPEKNMAYRVELLEGDKIFPTDVPILPRHGLIGSSLSRVRLRARLRIIPVDAAGNEGPASNTVVIGFDETDGCAIVSGRSLSTFAPTVCLLLWAASRRRSRAR
jgi:hypothetical protein